MPLKAVIAAGGLGVRIRSITKDRIPKALVPVAGVPIIVRQLELLRRYDIDEVVVLAGHLADPLIASLGPRAEQLEMKIEFCVEDRPLGTAGGLPAAHRFLSEADFYFLCGDIAVEMDLNRLVEYHFHKSAAATIVVHPNDHPQTSDLVAIDQESRVRAIMPRHTRPPGYYRNLVFASVYCLSPRIFDYILPDTPQDLNNDVLPRLLSAGEPIFAYNTPEYLRDIGSEDRLARVEADIRSGRLQAMHFANKRPAVFFDRDGVLTRDVRGRGVTEPDELELLPGAAEAVKRVNESNYLAVLVTNQSQVAKGFVSPNLLELIFAKFETLLGEQGARFDRIYFCPHHPERGFPGEVPELKVNCDCRKPKPGMLLRAAEELPLSLAGSCLIGDSMRDIAAAHAAGIIGYGVRTGTGCRDCIPTCRPALMFADAREAADFVVRGIPEVDVIAEEIVRRLQEMERPRMLIGVGGPRYSGKTTFSHALAQALKRKGLISIDHIRDIGQIEVPIGGAPDGSRLDLAASLAACQNAVQQQRRRPDSANSTSNVIDSLLGIDGASSEVRILDGIFACHHSIRENLDLAIYVECNQQLLVERTREIRRWLGDSSMAIDAMINISVNEEWPAVQQQSEFAHHVVCV